MYIFISFEDSNSLDIHTMDKSIYIRIVVKYLPRRLSWVQFLGECFLYATLGLDCSSLTSLSSSRLVSMSASLKLGFRQTEQNGSFSVEALFLLLSLPRPPGTQGSLLVLDTKTGFRLTPVPERICLVKLILNCSSSPAEIQEPGGSWSD